MKTQQSITVVLTNLAFVCVTSCATRRAVVNEVKNAEFDPLAGAYLQTVHSHGHDMLAVEGQLACDRPCEVGKVQVLSKRYADKSGYAETQIVVEPDGRYHGELAISYGGTANSTSYFPQALLFTLAGCQDAIVAVSSPWPGGVVELRCK